MSILANYRYRYSYGRVSRKNSLQDCNRSRSRFHIFEVNADTIEPRHGTSFKLSQLCSEQKQWKGPQGTPGKAIGKTLRKGPEGGLWILRFPI